MSQDPLFDATMHTQGGTSHLLQHLWDSYVLHLNGVIAERKAQGKPTVDVLIPARVPALAFIQWASNYLAENRLVETYFVDENVGLRLADGTMVSLSPGVVDDIRGTMQDAAAVAVTQGRSREGQSGIVPSSGTLPIS